MAYKYPKPEVQSRGEAFDMGSNPMENSGPGNENSLSQDSDKFNFEVPKRVGPSVLAPGLPTGNGMAAGDAQRQYVDGGIAPSPNGVSDGTYRAQMLFNNRRTEGI